MTGNGHWRVGVEGLQASTRGRVLAPGNDGYDASRRVFNAMIDRHPALIVRCENADDVVQGVEFARSHGLAVSVKGGGHSVAGSAVCDGGVMLDMGAMNGIVVDPAQRTAVAGPGLTLGQSARRRQCTALPHP